MKIFVSGFYGKTEGEKSESLHLIKPSGSDFPYYTKDPANRAMRLCGHTSALYAVDFKNKKFVKINDANYEMDGNIQPSAIQDEKAVNLVKSAISAGETELVN